MLGRIVSFTVSFLRHSLIFGLAVGTSLPRTSRDSYLVSYFRPLRSRIGFGGSWVKSRRPVFVGSALNLLVDQYLPKVGRARRAPPIPTAKAHAAGAKAT